MKTFVSRVLIVLVITSLFLFFGCGDGDSSSESISQKSMSKQGKIIVPCSLITKTEAEEILGVTLKKPELQDSNNPLGQKICLYSPTKDVSFAFLQISVVQTSAMPPNMVSSAMNAAKIYKQTKENMTDIKELTGIGDEAFWGTLGLHILTGDAYIVISLGSSSNPANMEKAKKIAGVILKKI